MPLFPKTKSQAEDMLSREKKRRKIRLVIPDGSLWEEKDRIALDKMGYKVSKSKKKYRSGD